MKEHHVNVRTYSNSGPVVTDELDAKLQERLTRQGEGEISCLGRDGRCMGLIFYSIL